MGEPPRLRRSPRRIAGLQRLPHSGRQALPPNPRGIADYQVEAAGAKDVPEVRLEGEERGPPLTTEPPRSGAEVAAAVPQTGEPFPLVGREPAPAPEKVAVLRVGEQLAARGVEPALGLDEEHAREARFRSGEVLHRGALGGPAQMKQ